MRVAHVAAQQVGNNCKAHCYVSTSHRYLRAPEGSLCDVVGIIYWWWNARVLSCITDCHVTVQVIIGAP